MGTRQVLYVDSIIGSSRSLFLEFANGLNPADGRFPDLARSYAMAISDVLETIGISPEGVYMALGGFANPPSDQDDGDPIPCFFCGKPARLLIRVQDGYRTVCTHCNLEYHMNQNLVRTP